MRGWQGHALIWRKEGAPEPRPVLNPPYCRRLPVLDHSASAKTAPGAIGPIQALAHGAFAAALAGVLDHRVNSRVSQRRILSPVDRKNLETAAINFLTQLLSVFFGRLAQKPVSASKANVLEDLLTNVFVKGQQTFIA
jgi:hypothetical protein